MLPGMITNELIRRRPCDRSELPEWYAQLFEAQRVDDLSTSEVASLLGVTPSNLYYWRRRLRNPGPSGKLSVDSGNETRGLVRVRVTHSEKSEGAQTTPPTLEVRLAGRRSIVVPVGFEPDNLRALVVALESC